VDQATITGESMPVEKSPGQEVYAGTSINPGTGSSRGTAGRDTTFGKIIQAWSKRRQSRAPIQRVAGSFGGIPCLFRPRCCGLTFLVTHNIRSTISVVNRSGRLRGSRRVRRWRFWDAIGRASPGRAAIIKGGCFTWRSWPRSTPFCWTKGYADGLELRRF